MDSSIFKKIVCLISFGCLLIVMAACTSAEPLWKTYPVSPAKPENATVADIMANPNKYDGDMVEVEGWVSSLQVNASRAGPYTTFQLGDSPGKTLSFVSLGVLPLKNGDFVRVTARYKKSADLIWIDSVEGPAMDRYK